MKLHSPARRYLKAAQKAWTAGDPRGALRELVQGLRADAGYKPIYKLAAQCLRALEAEDEARLVEALLADFHSAAPFYAAGDYYAGDQNFALALPLLERAHTLAPQRLDVALTLAQTYTSRFRPQDAYDTLKRAGLQGDFWATYEFYWAALLCNRDLTEIAEFVEVERAHVARADLEAELRESLNYALDKLAQALARLQAFPPESPPRIWDWHFIQYGGAILDYFDDREAEDALDIAGGRWVALWISPAHVAMLLHKLARLLTTLEREPQRVIALPDRDSQIIGRAAALVLDLPFALAEEGGEAPAQPHTLLVAADQRQLRDKTLLPVLAGQTIFALNLHWLHHGGLTPDIAGVLTQALYLPWNGGIRADWKTQEIVNTAPDKRPAEDIAEEVVATEPKQDARFQETLAFYRARAAYLKGGGRGGDLRLPFHCDSPVPGSYFA
jgi:hypothetical protein